MTDISRLCMVCLSETDENGICPDCRNNTEIVQAPPLLPLKTVLSQRYLIAKMQKQNAEGVSYSAYDIKLGKKVTVREFFPYNLANRDPDTVTVVPKKSSEHVYKQYLDNFIALWNKLSRLKGLSALITVTSVFEANSTAYAVYDESERITLRDWLLSTKEGYISWDKARLLFMPVLSTLGTLHTSGVLHRGINPSSFIFSSDGKLKITDFCTEPVRSVASAVDCELFDGYTPLEQYSCNETAGAESDIYSFCCVLYRALIGTTPIDARTRALNDQMMIPAKFAEVLPVYVINGLINGMEIKRTDRTENVEQLRSDLSASPRVMAASAVVNGNKQPIQTTISSANNVNSQQNQNSGEKSSANENLSANATKKINPLIMPISQDTPNTNNGTQTKTVTEKPRQAVSNTGINYENGTRKKRNVLIALGSGFAVLLIMGIIILVSSLIGRPLIGGYIVPQFVGEDISQIDLTSVSDVLNIELTQSYSTQYPANCVMQQSILQGTRVSKDTTVTLTVSLGPKVVTVPDVTSLPYSEAAKVLTDMGLICKIQNYISVDSSLYGQIYEVVPGVGSYVNQGDTVLIVIYAPPSNEEQTTSSKAETGDSVSEFFEKYNNGLYR